MRGRSTSLGRCRGLLCALGLAASPALAQVPVPPTGPVTTPHYKSKGPLHRVAARWSHKVHEHFIGDPALFVEPPLGYSVYETFGLMKAKADLHDFTLYRSDFVANTTQLSTGGAERLNRMVRRLDYWLGPILIEWTPETPTLAEERKAAVYNLMASASLPVVQERITVGPSPYHGINGDDAGLSHPIMIQRDARATALYPIPPIPVNSPGTGGVR